MIRLTAVEVEISYTTMTEEAMIAHLVLMKLERAEETAHVADRVLSMQGRVPGLLSITGGPSIGQERDWDVGFIMTFRDSEALDSYQSHPEHLRVAADIRRLITQMTTCDLSG